MHARLRSIDSNRGGGRGCCAFVELERNIETTHHHTRLEQSLFIPLTFCSDQPAMETVQEYVKPVREFAKDSMRLVKRCTKPDLKGMLSE